MNREVNWGKLYICFVVSDFLKFYFCLGYYLSSKECYWFLFFNLLNNFVNIFKIDCFVW